MKLRFLLGVAVFALAEFIALGGATRAQEPGSADWKQLQQHRNTWPAQLKLKAPVQLIIMRDGRQVGSIGAPADSMVQLLSVDDTSLRIGVGSAQASVAPGQTDLADRLANAPATNAAPVASVTPPPTTTNAPPASAVPIPSTTVRPANPASLPAVSGSPLQLDYEAPGGAGYDQAVFHFWSPAYTGALRGLIVMTPGADSDGRGMTKDAAWQALARKYQLGLVASFLIGKGYQRPEKGTGDAFRNALRHFAEQSGHPEIATVPLLLWGISAGGQWNYNYMLWRPNDVMAFVVNKGGYYNENDNADTHARATPGLFILGQADEDFRVHAITRIWKAGRSLGALWALAPQPGSGHEFSKTDPLARIFFEAVLKARLPDPNDLSSQSADAPLLKPMQENPGWLGNLTTHAVHDDSTDTDADRAASWLPDESTAQAWKIFVSGG